MSASSPPQANGSTSVFNALGSYADRIKEKAKSPMPNGTSSSTASSSITPSPHAGSTKLPSTTMTTSTAVPVDEGAWETVQSSRHRSRQKVEEDKGKGSNSKDWRERPAASQKHAEEERRTTESKSANIDKRKTPGSAPPATSPSYISSTAFPPVSTTKISSTPTTGVKNVWGIVTPATTSSHTSPPNSVISTTIQTPRSDPGSNTVNVTPSSPSIANTGDNTASIASPNLSSEVASTSTAPTSIALKDEEEEPSWRVPAKEAKETPSLPPVPAPRQPGPPPAVNAWEQRKKAALGNGPPGASSTSTAEKANGALQFGSVSPIDTSSAFATTANGVKIGKKQSKSTAGLVDTTAFPDLAQAAEIVQAAEEKKEKTKDKRESEDSSVADEPAASSRAFQRNLRSLHLGKPKWTAIPAQELLAAADEAAEASRRQARDAAARRKGAKRGESSHSPVKPGRRGSMESRRGRPGRSGSNEIRLPPPPSGSRSTSTEFKPVFGSVRPGSEGAAEDEIKGELSIGGYSAPLSRQTSRRSEVAQRAKTQVSSPNADSVPLDQTYPNIPPNPSVPNFKLPAHTAPLPQIPFSVRPPRRDNRGSFSQRGRFRRSFNNGWSSDLNGSLPDMPYVHRGPNPPQSNGYQRGYGMGYPSYHSANGAGFGFDHASQNQYGVLGMYNQGAARGGMPPPPLPQSIVPNNIDSLRYYVLGQVEYYFSMQNLAMDFFLRQQMDKEGWIDIAMIASFNRIKSLTPDVALVKEVMLLSNLLEVRDEKVRLARGESKRWVLPDAKPSTFTPDPISPSTELQSPPNGPTSTREGETPAYPVYSPEGYQYPEGFERGMWEDTMNMQMNYGLGLGQGMGMHQMGGYGLSMSNGENRHRFSPGEVENALMKNGNGNASGGGSTSGTTAIDGDGDVTDAGESESKADTTVGEEGLDLVKTLTPTTSVNEGVEERVNVDSI